MVDDERRSVDEQTLRGEPPPAVEKLAPLEERVPLHAPRADFAEYKPDARGWITLITGEYYPDILKDACDLYGPVLTTFAQLLRGSESSAALLLAIAAVPNQWMRVQLARVFRKYVSPETPVEMLKVKSRAPKIVADFSATFRPIQEVQRAFDSRPLPDEAICALLWEYRERGKKGYTLTTRLFGLLRERFPMLELVGPEGAGRDPLLHTYLPGYDNKKPPIDFLLLEEGAPLAVGLAHYDSDRGGSQEDDRTGQYAGAIEEIKAHADAHGLPQLRVVLVNDGPGLLLGTMWDDYANLERRWPGRIIVTTLRMLPERLTLDWLRS
jgi:hypothetical protein